MFKKVDNTPDGYTKMTKRETKALVRHLVKVKRRPKYRFVTCNGYCKTTPIGNSNQFIIDTELCFLVKVIFFLTGLFIMPYAILVDLKNDAGQVQFEINTTEVKTYSVHANNTRSLLYTHRTSYQAVVEEMCDVHGRNFALFYAEYMRKYA